jgi:hypothetical protein
MREGLTLRGGDADGPDGVKHSVSPETTGDGAKVEPVVDPTVTDASKVVQPVVDPAKAEVVDPTKTPTGDLDSGDLGASLEALVAKFNGNRTDLGTGKGKGRGSGRGKVVSPSDADATETTSEAPVAPTIDMLPKTDKIPVVVNPDLRDATADSAVRTTDGTTGTDATTAPGKRTITIPEVETARHADLIEGANKLNKVLKLEDASKEADNAAVMAEIKARDPLASDTVTLAAKQAREAADQAKEAYEKQRQQFTEYVESNGQGLQKHLETVAEQLKYPEKALELVQHDFAVKQGRDRATGSVRPICARQRSANSS